MSVTIRTYEEADAPIMAELYFQSVRIIGARHYRPEQVTAWAPASIDPAYVRARAADGRTTLVAINDRGEIVGYGDLEPDGHVDHLYCRPDAVGAGVGSKLLDELTRAALSMHIPRLFVEASEAARPLFERRGFELIRRRDIILRGVPIHNYAMEKALHQAGPDPKQEQPQQGDGAMPLSTPNDSSQR
ncbi:GNAT family N-acetyltransferase [Phenylobacterium sp.]|jgi:putative acetyltransferase|uniref:GNAT family N-acetyltransferase n=1 Tax=Phenylobacterium sp. TaxID=1871053 RepID=UPI002F40B7A6